MILQQDCYSDKIMILVQGNIEMRVTGYDAAKKKKESFIFGYLHQGTCFNVYNALTPLKDTSLISYIADSDDCQVEFIEVSDLVALAQHDK